MKRFLIAILLCLLAGSAAAQQDTTVDFGYVEWPGVTVKTHVASTILETLGYETELEALSVPIIFRGLSEGDLDAFLGVWRPSQNTMLEPYLGEEGDGSISLVTINLEPTIYRPGVPSYVAEQGITSFADVAENAEMFDGRIYGIEPGNDGNEIILEMIANDTYGFSVMELVPSSTQAMLTYVADAIEAEEPIVFLAWSPHWMNNVHDIAYLDDPQGVWGGDGHVATGVNTSWSEENENVTTFLSRLEIDPSVQNAWIDSYSRQGQEAAVVAETWVEENLDTVTGWLEGVETVDGEDAVAAVEEAFGD